MRRIAILLASGITAAGLVGAGSVMTAAPAHSLGDPLVQANVIVLPAEVNSIISICLTIRPSPPGCIVI